MYHVAELVSEVLGLADKLTLDKGALIVTMVPFDSVSTDGSGFNAFAGASGMSFTLMGAAVVGADGFGASESAAVVVGAGVGDVGADDGVVGTNVNGVDAFFEASAFDEGGALALLGFSPDRKSVV